MAKRPTNLKRAHKLRRMMLSARTPVGYIDLVQWLQDQGHANTSGQARDIIERGLVMADSHPLGMKEIYEGGHMDGPKGMPTSRLQGRPLVPAGLRGRIRVKEVPGV
jgi:hypothetical protein